MGTKKSNDLVALAEEIKSRAILTEYLTPTKHGFICPDSNCKNGSGNDGTGATVSKDNLRLLCGKCGKGFSNIDVIANYLGVGTSGKDFVEVVKFGCQIFGLPFADDSPVKNSPEIFERLEEAQNNLASFVKNQGGKWRGLSLETLRHINAGFLDDIFFPAAKKKIPAVIIPNDNGGIFARAVNAKYYKNNQPTATTTIFLPDSDSFDLFVTEGAINAASILQALPSPTFGIIASGGTSGNSNVLATLKKLKSSGKNFRVLIAYDFDSNLSGQKAAEKLLNLLRDSDFTACIVDITKILDVDLNDILTKNEFRSFKLSEMINSAIKKAYESFERIEKNAEKNLFDENMAEFFSNNFNSYVDENKKFVDRKTGFSNLDEKLKFFRPCVCILGGLPALGKTSFALQLLYQMAQQGNYCFYCSYEMEKGFLYSKLLAHEIYRIESKNFSEIITDPLTSSNISMGKIYEHGDAYNQALNILSNSKSHLHIWELDKINIDELLERLEKICMKIDKPPIVTIDYLQLFSGSGENAKSAIDDALQKIFAFRRRTNTTFIIISSLNRMNYNTEISFEAFKESGSIEYSADIIFGLQLYLPNGHTAESVEIAKKEIPRKIQLKCLKNRFGRNFDVGFFYFSNADFFKPMDMYKKNSSEQNLKIKGVMHNDKKGNY